MHVNIHQAKTQLSKLVHLAAKGEDVVLARDGKPVARIVRFRTRGKRMPGHAAGQGQMRKDFDKFSDEELSSFESDF